MANGASVIPRERVNIVYRPVSAETKGDVELPLKVLVLGDFTGREEGSPLEGREPLRVDQDNFEEALKSQAIDLNMPVADRLAEDPEARMDVNLAIGSLRDFAADALLENVPELRKLIELRGALQALKGPARNDRKFKERMTEIAGHPDAGTSRGGVPGSPGLEAFLGGLLNTLSDGNRVDEGIALLDQKLSTQMDEILHHRQFQTLEAAWRSLKFFIDRTDFRENIKVEVLNLTKEDLRADFADAPEIIHSGLYKQVYTREFGQFGGEPYGLLVGNFAFGPSAPDVWLLQKIAGVAAMAHAPFIAATDPGFFGGESFAGLPNLGDLPSILASPLCSKWQAFRESEAARYVGLTLPRFLLRPPYGSNTRPVDAFPYQEDTSSGTGTFLWGNAAFALASRVADSFARFRWGSNIIGPEGGGAVEGLESYCFETMGRLQARIPTEVLISEGKEFELAEEGFIPLSLRKGTAGAVFYSANSAQKMKTFPRTPEGRQAELDYRLGGQLPFLFLVSRLAHYLKVLQRENIGSWRGKDLESELNNWLRQYVADQDNPSAAVRTRRPLKKARVEVASLEGEPGWYQVSLRVQPHFKYLGALFTLSLAGKLDAK